MTRPAFIWQLHWPTTLFVIALLPCLLALGVWQLHRADAKRALQQQFELQQAAAPIDAKQLSATSADYTRVVAHGQFDNAHNLLLDNRVAHGRVGYEVLTPLRLDDGATLLVNRGWIAGDPARQTLPQIPLIADAVTVRGFIFRDTGNRLVTDNENSNHWPRVIEQIDFAKMPVLLGATIYPFTLRLDRDAPGALQAEWPVVTSSPERHVAYAVQWFAMAAVLAVMWLLRSCNLRQWLSCTSNEKQRTSNEQPRTSNDA